MQIFGRYKGAVEVLIATNIIVHIIKLVNTRWIFYTFGLQPISIFEKPWTLITNMFVHADLWHLLFNMIALFFFGLYLERLLGEEQFFKVYFLGGIFASLCYVLTSFVFGIPDPRVLAIGASGAVFAVMGALVVLRPHLTIFVNFLIPMPLYVWAILYTIMAVPAMLSPVGNIAHNAHLGGLVAGLIFGYYFKKQIPRQMPEGRYGYRFY